MGSRWVGGLLLVWGLRVGPCEVCAEDCLLVHLFSSPLLPSMIWRFGRILTRRRSVSLYLFGFRSFGFPFTRPTFPSRLSIFHGVCICAIETPLRLLLSRFPSRLTITRVGPRFRRFDDSRILNPFDFMSSLHQFFNVDFSAHRLEFLRISFCCGSWVVPSVRFGFLLDFWLVFKTCIIVMILSFLFSVLGFGFRCALRLANRWVSCKKTIGLVFSVMGEQDVL